MNMRLICIVSLLGCLCFAAGERFNPRPISPRYCKLGQELTIPLLKDGKLVCEVVSSPKNSRVAKHAAQELADTLSVLAGSEITVLPAPSGKATALLVGDREMAAQQNIDLENLDRDGFYIRSVGTSILIVGNDDPKANPASPGGNIQRGSLYGVFEFLERFLGVRYYFPGDIGTIIPRHHDLSLPSIDLCDRPDNQVRTTYDIQLKSLDQGQSWGYPGIEPKDMRRLSHLRMRLSTLAIPNCHGFAGLGLVQRFAKTRPDFFALKPDGSRHDGSYVTRPSDADGHLCFSNQDLKEEIYLDAAAFLQGKPASDRNIIMPNGKSYWSWSRFSLPFFNLMPNDCMYRCVCPDCQKHYSQGDQGTSNFIWRFKTDIARKIKENNIPGYLTMMAYEAYRLIPDVDIPDNCIVMLATTGPWAELQARQAERDQLLRDWNEKLQAKTYLWTYPTKCSARLPWLPNPTPRSVASFFQRQAPYIFGAFFESENDVWLFGYLNQYVFGKIMWDTTTDVEALLAEHHRLMFGEAAPMMADFYDRLEKHWLRDIVSNTVDTSEGPKTVLPSEYEIWNKIYSSQEVESINQLFSQAEKAVAANPDAARRLAFIKENLWGVVLQGRELYEKKRSDRDAWQVYLPEVPADSKISIDGELNEPAWQAAQVIHLIPRQGDRIEVSTRVRMLRDAENFYFAYECDEPYTDTLLIDADRQPDDPNVWQDNSVELFLDTQAKRQEYYQCMINHNGVVADLHITPGLHDYAWNSGLEVKTAIVPQQSWRAEIRIPRSSMAPVQGKRILANFTRLRSVKVPDGGGSIKVPYYNWCLLPTNLVEGFGGLHFEPVTGQDLIRDGEFAAAVTGRRFIGPWAAHKSINRDTEVFRSGGSSLRLDDNSSEVMHYLSTLKSKTTYTLSYYVKLDQVQKSGNEPSGFYFRFDDGNGQVRYPIGSPMHGTIPWTRQEMTFTTSDNVGSRTQPYICFTRRNATGMVWLDCVSLRESKP
jgi:hypothetical protein